MSQNGHEDKESRLDRLERIVEVLATVQSDMQVDMRVLTTAQVVLTDNLSKLATKVGELSDKVDQLSDNVNALVHVVDDLVRWRSDQERKQHP